MLIIGIAGGTGSGKTTVVSKILQNLNANEVNVLSQDNYYHDNTHLSLQEREKYSFVTHTRTGNHVLVEPREVLIVEGILVLTSKELLKEFDLKVFVHADNDERLIRRIRRDTQERGRDLEEVLHRYQTTLKPMHDEFIEPSKSYADIIIPNMRPNTVAIDFLTTVVGNSLKNS